MNENEITVKAPYDATFIKHTKNLGGKWDAIDRVWVFSASLKAEVDELLLDCYGYAEESANDETVTLKLTVNTQLSANKGPVSIAHYTLARAYGRDSGAKPGENVALLDGEICSGGSMKNWESIVDAGSVFKLLNVPLWAVKKIKEEAEKETYQETIYKSEKMEYPEAVKNKVWETRNHVMVPEGYSIEHGIGCFYFVKRETKPGIIVEEIQD